MSKTLLIAVIGGMSCVILSLSGYFQIPGGMLLTYFSAFPLLVVGFSLGFTAGAIATVTAITLALALTEIAVVALFTVVTALPSLLLLRMMLSMRKSSEDKPEWRPPGEMLCWLTGYGALAFVIVAYLAGGGQNGFEDAIRLHVSTVFKAMFKIVAEDMEPSKVEATAQMVEATARMVARYLPAIFVTSWLVSMVVNAHLAQNAVMRLKRNIRPAPSLLKMSLPFWLTGAMLVAAVMWRLAGPGLLGFVSLNLALILLVPFVFLGLAVIHSISQRWPSRIPILVIIYLVMVFIGWPVILVAALGLAEQWTGLRQRLAGPGNFEEDE